MSEMPANSRGPLPGGGGGAAFDGKLSLQQMRLLGFAVDEQSPDYQSVMGRDTGNADEWHPFATELYESLRRDPSDMVTGPAMRALDLAICETISREMRPQYVGTTPVNQVTGEGGEPIYEPMPLKGATLNAILSWAKARGLDEMSRRRIGLTVQMRTMPTVQDSGPKLHLVTGDRSLLFRGDREDQEGEESAGTG